MTHLPTIPRITTLFALALLGACTSPSAEEGGETDGETGDTGEPVDQGACEDPGSELLDNVKPALLPSPQVPVMYTCTSGWGTDAPHLDPEWTIQIGDELSEFNFGFSQPVMAAHPDGGAILAGLGNFTHIGADGEEVWSNPAGSGTSAQYDLALEDAGTILLSIYDWNTSETSLTRYAADGTSMGEIMIPWNSSTPAIWGIDTLGTDIVIGGNDQDSEGSYETTLLRLDADGNLVLRKSTNMTGGQQLAVSDTGVAVFGSFPPFLVSLDNGEVLGMFAPSMGNASQIVGHGDDFFIGGGFNGTTTNADFAVGRYTSLGGETWLQGYDRASLGDAARAIGVGPDGTLAAAGNTSLLNPTDVWWYGGQPIVMGVDADGNALWSDRISAHGDALAVAVGSDGVYVAGFGDAGIDWDPNDDPPIVMWMRRYVP